MMNDNLNIDLRAAFGETPPTVDACIRRALRSDTRRYIMKRKMAFALTAALLAVLMLGTVALAGQYGVPALFSTNDMQNEQVAAAVQPMNQTYAGQYVSLTITEGLYDTQGSTFALAWEGKALTEDANLAVNCDGLTLGGQTTIWNSDLFDGLSGSIAGALYEGDTPECEIRFSVVRVPASGETAAEDEVITGEYAVEASAFNPLRSDEYEVLEQFTMSFTLPEQNVGQTLRLKGENRFVFDGYELIVQDAQVNATSAYISVAYITSEAPKDLGKGFGPAWDLTFTLNDDVSFCAVSNGGWEDPVQLEDGRWQSVYNLEAQNLFVQPTQLVMTLTTYTLDETTSAADAGVTALAGEENIPVATVHQQEAVTLTFE